MLYIKGLMDLFNKWRASPFNVLISVLCALGGWIILWTFIIILGGLSGCNGTGDGMFATPSGKGVILCGEAIIITDDEATQDQIKLEIEYLMAIRAMYCLPRRNQPNE